MMLIMDYQQDMHILHVPKKPKVIGKIAGKPLTEGRRTMTKAQKNVTNRMKRKAKVKCTSYGDVKHKPMCDLCKKHMLKRFNACVRKTFRKEFHAYYEDGVRILEEDFAKAKGF